MIAVRRGGDAHPFGAIGFPGGFSDPDHSGLSSGRSDIARTDGGGEGGCPIFALPRCVRVRFVVALSCRMA
jgi:hypothetical protein